MLGNSCIGKKLFYINLAEIQIHIFSQIISEKQLFLIIFQIFVNIIFVKIITQFFEKNENFLRRPFKSTTILKLIRKFNENFFNNLKNCLRVQYEWVYLIKKWFFSKIIELYYIKNFLKYINIIYNNFIIL